MQTDGPNPRVFEWAWGGASDSAVLTNSLVVVMMVVQGADFEGQYTRRKRADGYLINFSGFYLRAVLVQEQQQDVNT